MPPRLPALLLAALLLPLLAPAQVPRLHLKPVVLGQIDSPTAITHAGDGSGRLFVCDQTGLVRIVRDGMLLLAPFLDLSASGLNRLVDVSANGSERGLLGLAFHPDYESDGAPGEGRFYVYYSAPAGNIPNPPDHVSVVSEFRVSGTDPDLADPASERIVLAFDQPQSNHNGGQIAFGPDGGLYIGSGDGGGGGDNEPGHTGGGAGNPSGGLGNSQDRTNLLGKILRIDPLGTNGPGGSYGIPGDNPFAGAGGGIREEIHAYGLRNPWRFSFDARPGGTGRLFCGDVGQGRVEEVNVIVSGGNYGWRYREGTFEFDATMVGAGTAPATWIDPVGEYAHPGVNLGSPALPQLGLSITGGYVYRGSAIPGLEGIYVFADYRASGSSGGRLMALIESETSPPSGVFTLTQSLPLTETNPLSGNRRILTLGEDEDGELYVGTKTSALVSQRPGGIPEGAIYRLVAAVPASTPISLPANRDTSLFESTSNSSGAGEHLYAGRTGTFAGETRRRALVRFDLAAIPAETDVVSASVTLHQNLGASAPRTMSLHRLTADWGEAGSNSGTPGGGGAPAQSGDATWTHRFHPSTVWAAPGGDFAASPSATAVIDSTAPEGPVARTWEGVGLAADVEGWRAAPATNFGWILLGDEDDTATAQRFLSRESTAAGGTLRPRLDLIHLVAPPPSALEEFLATRFPGDPVGAFHDLAGDEDGNGLSLLLEHGLGIGAPAFGEPTPEALEVRFEATGGGAGKMVATFRRDPGATGLRLTLFAGSGIGAWTAVAESLGGAVPVGQNGATVTEDAEIPGEAPVRQCTVELPLTAGDDRRFARLEADLLP